MRDVATFSVFALRCLALLLCACGAPEAVYFVRISDLRYPPTPPNPIKVAGTVVSESPLRISDGRAEIELAGISARMEDLLVVEGDYANGILSVSQAPMKAYCFPASTRAELIYIPAGSFLMGNNGAEPYVFPDELPQHVVYVSGFWIGKYEVTRGEYRKFIRAGGYFNPSYWSREGWEWRVANNRVQPAIWEAEQDWGTGPFVQSDEHPVVGVSYYEAEAFCRWAGGRLPTEAERQKAARWTGNHSNIYPWGDDWDEEKCNGLYDSLYPGHQTAPVGQYLAGISPYGCYDMAGNVWEWLHDWYDEDYYSQTPPEGWIDPTGPPSGTEKVLGGGASWSDYGNNLFRCAWRDISIPAATWADVGLRMAR